MKKKWKIGLVLRKMLVFFVVAFLVWFAIHHVLSFYEKKKYLPLGQLVEVDGKEMHVFVKGSGEHTILLWSGLGTPAPVLDFEPLITELAMNHRVVVVENFGYGWSDLTDKKRTVENIVEETIAALTKSGIEGPYILMPHSISGIYSMFIFIGQGTMKWVSM
jgi:hypothetical protein